MAGVIDIGEARKQLHLRSGSLALVVVVAGPLRAMQQGHVILLAYAAVCGVQVSAVQHILAERYKLLCSKRPAYQCPGYCK